MPQRFFYYKIKYSRRPDSLQHHMTSNYITCLVHLRFEDTYKTPFSLNFLTFRVFCIKKRPVECRILLDFTHRKVLATLMLVKPPSEKCNATPNKQRCNYEFEDY